MTEASGDDVNPTDKRWNKIPLTILALRSWAADSKILVFIDADVTILDFNLSFEDITDMYPTTDIFLCADALDVANTGMLIVRNTLWAISFLEEWWNRKDSPGTFCDQHVFNRLYAQAINNTETALKIKIFPANTFNSRWPVTDKFHYTDKVLHLMGETDNFRFDVASHAAATVCYHIQSSRQAASALMISSLQGDQVTIAEFPFQLDITHSLLNSLFRKPLQDKYNQLISRLTTPVDIPLQLQDNTVTDVLIIFDTASQLCDETRPSINITAINCAIMFNETANIAKVIINSILSMPILQKKEFFQSLLDLYDKLLVSLIQVIHFASNTNDKLAIASQYEEHLIDMSRLVNSTNLGNQMYLRLQHAKLNS
jgi:hypothetical protein